MLGLSRDMEAWFLRGEIVEVCRKGQGSETKIAVTILVDAKSPAAGDLLFCIV